MDYDGRIDQSIGRDAPGPLARQSRRGSRVAARPDRQRPQAQSR